MKKLFRRSVALHAMRLMHAPNQPQTRIETTDSMMVSTRQKRAIEPDHCSQQSTSTRQKYLGPAGLARLADLLLKAGLFCFIVFSNVQAATFVVNTTADPISPATVGCDATECTLREAITAANTAVGADTINFNIAGSGELLISVNATHLPTAIDTLTIDGYSQPGSGVNTLAKTSNALIRIRVDGAATPFGSRGIAVCDGTLSLRGLSVTGFSGTQVSMGVQSNATGCAAGTRALVLHGNFIGLDTAGVAIPTAGSATAVSIVSGLATVGSANIADRNVIGGNVGCIRLPIGSGASVLNNLIGTDPSAQFDRGCNFGIFLDSTITNSVIGSSSAPNLIAFNTTGIVTAVNSGAINNVFANNEFILNDGLGIDLTGDGVTANDLDDVDVGHNGRQNFPVINTASLASGNLTVNGTLDVVTTAAVGTDSYQLAFYASDRCDSSGFGEGERLLGVATRTLTDASESFNVVLPTTETFSGRASVLTMTATRATIGTSEFSQCFAMGPVGAILVNATDDTQLGVCNSAHCNLREAILEANLSPGADVINFAIPGAGPHRINLTSVLPAITQTVTINGYSQAGASVNTHSNASNANLKIIVDAGAFSSASTPIISIIDPLAAGSVVRGLSFVDAPGNAPFISIAGDVKIQGNWFGIEPDGVTLGTMNGDALRVTGTGSLVGGSVLEHRNVIGGAINGASGSTAVKVTNTITNATIENNIIGLKPDGITSNFNLNGLSVAAATQTNVVVRNNTLSCNSLNTNIGLGTLIENNRIGTTSDGIGNPVCDSDRSIFSNNAVVRNNVFAFGSARAAEVSTATTGVVFSGNRFISNAIYHIDLASNGHSANDLLDLDTGANNLQNFPHITSARRITDTQLEISGTLNSLASSKFKLEFFGAAAITRTALSGSVLLADATWFGTEDLIFTTDISGNFNFGPIIVNFPGAIKVNVVSATATRVDASNVSIETSELGPALATFENGNADLVVTNANAFGEGSFFAAFTEANARPDAIGIRDRITFNIPGTPPFLITPPLVALNAIGALEIDGYSQPGSAVNTAALGTNAVITIQLRTVSLNFANSSNGLIRGVSINGTTGNLPFVLLNNNSAIEGSFLGIASNGTSFVGNPGTASSIECSSSGCLRVGGPSLAQRNLISLVASANAAAVLGGSAGASVIENNLIGVQRNGLTTLQTPPTSPVFTTASRGIQTRFVGSATNRDVIRGNVLGGISIGVRLGGQGALIEQNFIGVASNNLTAIGNSGAGVWIESGSDNVVQNNIIANSASDAIEVANSSVLNALIDNTMRSNGNLAIDLGSENFTNNDPLDNDVGANGLQNFPVIMQAVHDGSGVRVSASLDSIASSNFRIRYCMLTANDGSSHGECERPVVGVSQDVTTNSSNSVSFTSPVLPFTAGNIAVTATAARILSEGEETSEFSVNVPIINLSQTQILSISASPARVGQSFTVNVQVSSPVPGFSPTGSVNITTAPNVGSCTVAAINASGLGSCDITSAIAGDIFVHANYVGSASATVSAGSAALTILRALTTTTITSDNADPSSPGAAITVTLSVASSAGTPTGQVDVNASGGGNCNATLSGGIGFCSLTPTASGPITITANYLGDNNFDLSNDDEAHSVGVSASSLVINSSTPNPSVFGQSVSVNATLSSAFGVPAGPITITDGAGASCQILSANGVCNLVPTNVGNDIVLRADFLGDAAHTSSTANLAHVVNKANTSLTPGLPFRVGIVGDIPAQDAPMRVPVNIAAVSPGAGSPTGTIVVQALAPENEICVITLPANFCDLTPLSFGLRNFSVTYSGDNRFNSSLTNVDTPVISNSVFQDGFECFDESCFVP